MKVMHVAQGAWFVAKGATVGTASAELAKVIDIHRPGTLNVKR